MIRKDDTNPNEEVIDLGLILSLLWKHVALILTCGIICAAALFMYRSSARPEVGSTAFQ